jgi:hypothetical protein
MLAVSVCQCQGVLRPPMSQRSHIAYRGSRAMSACSAACSEPGVASSSPAAAASAVVSVASAPSIVCPGMASQNAWVVKVCSGKSRLMVSMMCWSVMSRFW